MKKAILLSVMLVLSFSGTVLAGECVDSSWVPTYVRMGSSAVYHVDGNGFTRVYDWNDVQKTYGHNVGWAQGQTCGCTLRQPGNNYHANPVCRRAYDQGLQ